MSASEERVNLAMSLGLSLYEARGYLALSELGEAKASQIAAASDVPRGRIYEVLQALHEKGLVAVLSAAPLRYRAAPLHRYVEQRKKELRSQSENLEGTAAALVSKIASRAVPGRTGDFLLYRRRGPVVAKVREMLEAARKEIRIGSTEGCTNRLRALFLSAIREKSKEGVDIRISTTITPASADAVRALSPYAGIRHNPLGNRGITVFVVDGEQALIVHWNPDDDDPYHGEDAGLWSTDPGIVESFQSIVQDAWDRGVEARSRLRELETGEEPETTQVVSRYEAIVGLIPAATAKARKEIAVTVSASALEVAHAPEFQPTLEALQSTKLRKRMLVLRDRPALGPLQPFADYGFEVRIARSTSSEQYLLIDRKEIFTRIWRAPPVVSGVKPPVPTPEDRFVRTNARSIVDALADSFELEWGNAIPLEDAASEKGAAQAPVNAIPG